MRDPLYALAIDLLSDLEPDARGNPGAAMPLPGGRIIGLELHDDGDSSIRVDGMPCNEWGTLAWRGRDSCTGLPASRPAGFDGAARVLHGDSRGYFRDSAWWQPPAGLTPDQVDSTFEQLRAFHHGYWRYVGIVATVYADSSCMPGTELESASVWGVAVGYGEGMAAVDQGDLVADLLHECGIDGAVLDIIARMPALADLRVC